MAQEQERVWSELSALVVDASPFERNLSIEQLRIIGFGRVLGAGSADEAWALLVRNNPDVLFVEWTDSGAEALDLLRRVRTGNDAPNPAMNMFILSSRSAHGNVEAARRAGADAFMRKPISGIELRRRIRTVISKPQPFVSTPSYAGPCRRRRADPLYAGPWRRLEDVVQETAETDDADPRVEIALGFVAALEARVGGLGAGDAGAARDVFQALRELISVAAEIDDGDLKLGAQEMARYVQSQGATSALDPEVVRTHVAALRTLAHLPRTLATERHRVALSLRRMIDKKLRAGGPAL
jgi:DNA-binding response OmpR family regulator